VILHSLRWGGLTNISLKVPKLYSLDLLAKVGWRQCRVVRSEESNVMGRGLVECTTEEASLTCRFNFEFRYIFNLDGCIITKFWWSWKGYLLDGNLKLIFSVLNERYSLQREFWSSRELSYVCMNSAFALGPTSTYLTGCSS
jgi:hypothetical protein